MSQSLSFIRKLSAFRPYRKIVTAELSNFFVDDQPADPLLPLDFMTEHSPVFARYRGRARWLQHGDRGMLVFQIVVIMVIILIMVVGVSVIEALANRFIIYRTPEIDLIQHYIELSTWLLIVSVPLSFLHDLYCMNVALTQVRRDSLFELLRLSRMSHRGIIISYYAGIRWGAWRMMSLVFAMRAVGTVIFVFGAFVLLPIAQRSIFSGNTVTLTPVSMLIQIGVAVCLSIAFVMEARWRLNGVAARALTVAVSRESAIPKTFVGIFSLFRLWIGQVIALTVGMFAVTSAGVVLVGWLTAAPPDFAITALLGITFLFLIASLLLYFIHFYYGGLTQFELRRAERIAFAPERN